MTGHNQPCGETLPLQTVWMMQACNQADRETLSAIRYAAEKLCIRTDEAGLPLEPELRSAYLTLMKTGCRLQYQIACSEELLSYENGLNCTDETIDLCRMLRHFVNLTEELSDGRIMIGECMIPHGLYAQMQPERLNFVLLDMLSTALRELPEANVMDFTAETVQTELRIEMVLRHDAERETEPFAVKAAEDDALPYSPASLTKRFCACCQARILRRFTDGKCVCVLGIPAAAALNPLVKVGSDSAYYPDDALFRSVLSDFIPMETILTAAADCM